MMGESGAATNRSIGRMEAVACFLLPALIACVAGAQFLPNVLAGSLLNPDSYMRLVRIEDTLQQHHIVYFVQRDGSGTGALLHWSHLLDSIIILLAAPFSLFFDQHTALHAAAVLFGPLCMGGLGLALVWAIAPFARKWRWLAPAVAALTSDIVGYGLPGVVHHHVLLVIVAVITSGCAVRAAAGMASARTGIALGTCAGAGIWLSPESMPFTLMALGGLWLAWLVANTARRSDLALMVRATGASFLFVVAAALAVDPPFAGYAVAEIDRISLVYLVLALLLAAVGSLTPLIDRYSATTRLTLGLAAPAFGFALWLVCFPSVLLGPDGLMTAQQTQEFFSGIGEMQPVRGFGEVVVALAPGLIAAAFFVANAWMRRSLLFAYAALCVLVCVLLGAQHIRFSAYAAASGAAILPVLITLLSERDTWSELVRMGARLAVFATFMAMCSAEFVPGLAVPAQAAVTPQPSCSIDAAVRMLAPYPGQVVLTHVDDVPELLYRTRILTVASLYHRNIDAFQRWHAAWFSGPADTLPRELNDTKATLVLFCPRADHWPFGRPQPPANSLVERMLRGDVPPWLQPIDRDVTSGNVLYEVKR
jgi:hypothetical protein